MGTKRTRCTKCFGRSNVENWSDTWLKKVFPLFFHYRIRGLLPNSLLSQTQNKICRFLERKQSRNGFVYWSSSHEFSELYITLLQCSRFAWPSARVDSEVGQPGSGARINERRTWCLWTCRREMCQAFKYPQKNFGFWRTVELCSGSDQHRISLTPSPQIQLGFRMVNKDHALGGEILYSKRVW